MSLRLKLAELYLPRSIRARRFRELFGLTARAVESPVPLPDGLSFEEERLAFARFTQNPSERLAGDDHARAEAERRLRESAYDLGQRLRKDLGVRSRADVMRSARLLYRLLGIDFQGTEDGTIIIPKCFFAETYSARTCDLISALDEGLLAGLAGGGTLVFSERITENRPCCRARFGFLKATP